MIYDKYDIWKVTAQGGDLTNLTGGRGREEQVVFRVIDLDDEEDTIDPASALMLSGYDDREKHDAFYSLLGGELEKLYGDGGHRLHVIAKADEADRLLFTRERYDEFPDLWVTNLAVESPRSSATSTRRSPTLPGERPGWWSGRPRRHRLQGVLIKPEGWEPGKRFPVLVYYYRFFSQRLHLFNEPVVNHRPSFPVYASHGYAVFLPDIRFDIGHPGPSARSV